VPRQTADSHGSHRRDEKADHSKEIRTAREAAIVTLLDHPYICALREVVQTNHHWYMMFEYVNGGQMLDYIISHGKLKEKQARKFCRQIASALDYCHRNSIVHRDLKIENILISKSGDIKIIDFGLSNLFSPQDQLKTFCGSLYFAAPELLQARQYVGPEVDVWSFGIVMYVLVCGKVPFDDQSMPQLHAKIKKGHFDYPPWLSTGKSAKYEICCNMYANVSLECRDLISRMLQVNPRDRITLKDVMQHPWMLKGFNGPPENFLPHREPLQLPLDAKVIENMTGFDFGTSEYITNRLTKIIESESYQSAIKLNNRDLAGSLSPGEKKRAFPGFDFYKRRGSTNSKDMLVNASVETLPLGQDPINAFDPLISIYYLVREAQDREQRKATQAAQESQQAAALKNAKPSPIASPEAAYTNSQTYEAPGEAPTGGRTRPRARTHGEDEITDSMKRVDLGQPREPKAPTVTPQKAQDHPPTKKESAAAGLLRRFSTRRHKDHDRSKHSASLQVPESVAEKPTTTESIEGKDPSTSKQAHASSNEDSIPPLAPTSTVKSNQGLGRSTSVIEPDWRRRQSRKGVSEGTSAANGRDSPIPSGSEASTTDPPRSRPNDASSAVPEVAKRSSAMRTKSLGHARRESIQARRARRDQANASLTGDSKQATPREPSPESIEVEEKGHGAEIAKPVFLKGLFSVSTTSTKPVSMIRADIVRVLDTLGVDYKEIKGGFSCRHVPSIDLEKVSIEPPATPDRSNLPSGHRRKISFGGLRRDNPQDDRKDLLSPKSPRRPKGNEGSFTGSDGSNESIPAAHGRGVNSTEMGGNMILQYEIYIVKVPLLSLHGIQFKRVAGDTWQYKEMATKILNGLKL
jgi:serine/threonine protein kinase